MNGGRAVFIIIFFFAATRNEDSPNQRRTDGGVKNKLHIALTVRCRACGQSVIVDLAYSKYVGLFDNTLISQGFLQTVNIPLIYYIHAPITLCS